MDQFSSSLTIKRTDDEQRVIEGIATSPTPDRAQDVVLPRGARFKTPLPLLLDHDHRKVVGQVEHAEVTDRGITFRARIAKIDEPGEAKTLVDTAWQFVKSKLRSAVSIGFRPLPDGVEMMSDGGLKFKQWEWLELSLVGITANPDAQILSAKSAHTRRGSRVVRLGSRREAVQQRTGTTQLTATDLNRARIIADSADRVKNRLKRQVKITASDVVEGFLAEKRSKRAVRNIEHFGVVRLNASEFAKARGSKP